MKYWGEQCLTYDELIATTYSNLETNYNKAKRKIIGKHLSFETLHPGGSCGDPFTNFYPSL